MPADHSDADPEIDDVIREFIAAAQAHLHTMELGKVQSFDALANPPTADIRRVVRRLRYNADGEIEQYEVPLLHDVPIMYPVSADCSIYFPLAAGDEVLIQYLERDSDNAIETGEDVNDATTYRRHSDMDPVAYPMAWSNSVPLNARNAGAMTIEHKSNILLGKGATQFATTGQRVLDRLALLEAKVNAIIAIAGDGGTPISGSVSALTLTVLLDLIGAGAKVKIEEA